MDPRVARRPINARSETVATAAPFRAAYRSRRCIVPADAFYEWRTQKDGKQPFAFARQDGAPMASDGEVRRTFTILTTAANAIMRPIHNRMPVILEREDWAAWLGEVESDLKALCRPAADDVFQSWMVGRRVNSPKHNGADLIERASGLAPPQDEGEAGPDSA